MISMPTVTTAEIDLGLGTTVWWGIAPANGDREAYGIWHDRGLRITPDKVEWSKTMVIALNRFLREDGAWALTWHGMIAPDGSVRPPAPHAITASLHWFDLDGDLQLNIHLDDQSIEATLASTWSDYAAGAATAIQRVREGWQDFGIKPGHHTRKRSQGQLITDPSVIRQYYP